MATNFDRVCVYGVSFERDKQNTPEVDGVVCLYKEDIPFDAIYVNKITGISSTTRGGANEAMKCYIRKVTPIENEFGLIDNSFRFNLGLRSFWNKEFKIQGHWPAFYNVSAITRCERSGFFRVTWAMINGNKLRRFSETDPKIQYLFSFLETIINELAYLPGYSFEGKKDLWDMEKEYYTSQDRQKLLFWLSHYDELPHGDMALEVLEAEEREYTGNSSGEPKKPPKYDRNKMEVPGTKLFSVWIGYCKTPGDGILTSKGYLVINFKDTPGHAFWVIRYSDYQHFINEDGKFDRSKADISHPMWRFYHTPGGYDALEKFAF